MRSPLPFIRQICFVAAAALAALGACSEPLDNTLVPDDNQNASADGPSCLEDSDCVPAGPKCCSCPTYAVSTADPVARACANVDCPVSECAEDVIARCGERHRCELACAPRSCGAAGAACQYGLAVNKSGCLTCECAAPEPGGCTVDADCTRTRADCCGCQQGGFDTAVLVTAQASHEASLMLMCSPTPACPGLNTCTADVPTCVQGRCALVSPSLPAGACGRADLPACPAGTECLVNVNDQANMHGVGVCGTLP